MFDRPAEGYPELTPEENAEISLRHIEKLLEVREPGAFVTVMFDDTLTPSLYGDDPYRSCFYFGEVIRTGRNDETGPWIDVRVINHTIQVTSAQAADPEYSRKFNEAIEPLTFTGGALEAAFAFMAEHQEKYPETSQTINLDPPSEPMRLRLRETRLTATGVSFFDKED